LFNFSIFRNLHKPLQKFVNLVTLLVAPLLMGCGGFSTPLTQTVQVALFGHNQTVDTINLNTKLRYLRVTVRDQALLMVLGYVEPQSGGDIESWYSSDGKVLKLQNGRLYASFGLETDWRSVRNVALLSWADAVSSSMATYQRERDEMPGYRFSIPESLTLYAIPPPNVSKLVVMSASSLTWMEETVNSTITTKTTIKALGKSPNLASGRFGLQLGGTEPQVVYGEQCLAPSYCIAWQVWPAKK
jgi:hypothetical protein